MTNTYFGIKFPEAIRVSEKIGGIPRMIYTYKGLDSDNQIVYINSDSYHNVFRIKSADLQEQLKIRTIRAVLKREERL